MCYAVSSEPIATNMDDEIRIKLEAIEKKLDAVFGSAEKTRKYFMWTLIVTVAMVVLPLIGLAFVIPAYLSTLSGLTAGL